MNVGEKNVVPDVASLSQENLHAAINLRLALLDLPSSDCDSGDSISRLVSPILARQREMSRRLSDRLCPTDARIQGFLKEYLADTGRVPSLSR